jgi:glycosyltransferase involved in cell wall biosynthesis
MTRVSVVVPTRNRAAFLPRLLAALGRQTYDDFEVVIVDDASTDNTWEILQSWCGVNRRAFRKDSAGGSYAARNRGWIEADGSLIAFTDDDCLPEPGWLSALVARVTEPEVVGVQGRTLARPGEVTPFTHQIEQTHGGPPYRTCNVLYRRSELERQFGFEDQLRWYADNIFGLRARASGSIVFSPEAVVLHPPRPREWRTRSQWLQRFEADAIHRRELQRLGVEPTLVQGKVLPLILWIARPIVKQSLTHLQYAIRYPRRYLRGLAPMAREKGEMLLALRDYWRQERPDTGDARSGRLPILSATPEVSVVIVTKSRPQFLSDALRAISRGTWPAYEVLVVDNGRGEAAPVAARFGARYMAAEGMTLGAARQRGVDASTREIVAFTDDDCLPERDWLAAIVGAFKRHPDWYGVQGRTNGERGPIGAHAVSVQSPNALFHTCNIAYRREALGEAGGFDPGFVGWFEDTALGARVLMHGTIGWEPRAQVLHGAVPHRVLDEDAWRQLLCDERRLATRYPDFYHRTRGPSFLVAVVLRWTIGSPAKALIRELPRMHTNPRAYARLALTLLRERISLLRALRDFV